MKQSTKLVVVIPVGPLGQKLSLHYVEDTLHSIVHYTPPATPIIIMDDSGPDDLGARLQVTFPTLHVVPAPPKRKGTTGGLYLALLQAYRFAYDNFDFRLLLKMDTDALMLGPVLDEAIDYFERHANVGQIGTYLVMDNGRPSEFSWASQQLQAETSTIGLLKNPARCLMLRRALAQAQANGYTPGEHCLGGANFMSWKCLHRLIEAGLLVQSAVGRSGLQEDHLFGLLVKAAGMNMGDFGGPSDPLAIQWKGLPDSPQRLLERGKKITHSTRFWNNMNEDDIRQFFRTYRVTV